MAFTVEDGSGVAGANSYVSVADARSYALDRGLTLPDDALACEQALVKAADYLDTHYENRLQGRPVATDQTMQWPRQYVYVDSRLLSYTAIPARVVAAQIEAAVAITAGVDLSPSGVTSAPVKRTRVGSLETEYATEGGRGRTSPKVSAVDRLMRPLLRGGGRTQAVRS